MQPFDAQRVPLDGPMLVEASAGTGKTYAITTLVLRMLLERELPLHEILVVTFTEAATAELRERVRGRLHETMVALRAAGTPKQQPDDAELAAIIEAAGDAERALRVVRRALEDIDQAAIFTIHGFCHRILRDYAVDSGTPLGAELLTDTSALLDEVLYDFWALELASASAQQIDILRRLVGGPSSCRSLISQVTRSPDMRLMGASEGSVEQLDLRPFFTALAAATLSWRRDEIEPMLVNAGDVLKRNLYPAASIPNWCAAADRYLSAPPEFPQLFEKYDKFCADTLLKSCKKNQHKRVPQHPFFQACQLLRDTVAEYDLLAAPLAVDFKKRLAAYAREQLPTRKQARSVLSFDDLLTRLSDALKLSDGQLAAMIRGRYRVALIDEFQDTDPIQYDIFKRIWPQQGLFVIGDPKQAIYAFRGADVFAYLRAAEAIAPERAFTMTTNWRSDAPLVNAVNALFASNPQPFVLPKIAFHPVSPRPGADSPGAGSPGQAHNALASALHLRLVNAPNRRTSSQGPLSQLVAADIAALLRLDVTVADAPLTSGDIAVLTRSNAQAFAVQQALTDAGVRSVVLGDQSVLEPNLPDSLMVQRILAAVLEPTRSGLLRAALSSRIFGVTAAELAEMDKAESASASARWQGWVERFRRYNQRWVERGFIQMFRSLLVENDVYSRLLCQLDGERRVTNLLHLVELLHRASVEEHLGPLGLFQWLRTARALARTGKARSDALQVRLESDDRAVKITTIHKSKGLEYPIVYCPFLHSAAVREGDQEVQFHDPRQQDALTLLLHASEDPEVIRQLEREQLAEGVRLLYVALTRARHHCVAYFGRFHGWRRSALGYLLFGAAPFAMGGVSLLDKHLRKLDDDAIYKRLQQLAEPLSDAILLSRVSESPVPPAVIESPLARAALHSRLIPKPIARWSRTASFTELSSRKVTPIATFDPHDWDARRLGTEIDPTQVEAEQEPREEAPPATLATFPRGARAGTFLHALLEHWDFVDDDHDHAVAHAQQMLAAFGYDAERWAEEVGAALLSLCRTQLVKGRKSVRLCDITRDQRLDELEFLFPVARPVPGERLPRGTQLQLLFAPPEVPAGRQPHGRLTAKALASVFAEHPSPELPQDYAERIRQLLFLPLEGFMKGFIDLIFCHKKRWYVVDYKSNHLGETLHHYEPSRLAMAMASSHYYLQYHLYAVALHRYLKRRLSRYRYDRHFGGVYYLFLRGMTPKTGPRYGVFFERPPKARIDQLSELLRKPARASSGARA